MNGNFIAAVLVMSISVLMAGCTSVRAAFYFEGIGSYQKAPNCVDPYASACGRYGHVPHDPDVELPAQPPVDGLPGTGPDTMYPVQPDRMRPRIRTREGLDK